jgi:hypothetical protein
LFGGRWLVLSAAQTSSSTSAARCQPRPLPLSLHHSALHKKSPPPGRTKHKKVRRRNNAGNLK